MSSGIGHPQVCFLKTPRPPAPGPAGQCEYLFKMYSCSCPVLCIVTLCPKLMFRSSYGEECESMLVFFWFFFQLFPLQLQLPHNVLAIGPHQLFYTLCPKRITIQTHQHDFANITYMTRCNLGSQLFHPTPQNDFWSEGIRSDSMTVEIDEWDKRG